MANLRRWLAVIGPGILVAATGVGAGDLATASFAGSILGTPILWAVVVGAVMKYVLTEGLTRWQLATGTTLLEGCVRHFGYWFRWLFLSYLIVWSYLVAIALLIACTVAAQAIFPIAIDSDHAKVAYGVLHSIAAIALVWFGGYKVFERVMSVCIGLMFLIVLLTAFQLSPPFTELLSGLVFPRIPNFGGDAISWTIALLGGVGGTMTILCYGYWIREEDRILPSELGVCRVDLAVGYSVTAFFGLSMVIIGSALGPMDGKGATLVVSMADTLQHSMGSSGVVVRWAFMLGAWGAFFSSLLGVWQSIPYLFADFMALAERGRRNDPIAPSHDSPIPLDDIIPVDTTSWHYRGYLLAIGLIPLTGLFLDFRTSVKIYAIVGAMFLPMLAATLLYMNGRKSFVGNLHTNGLGTTIFLVIILLFFAVTGLMQIYDGVQSLSTS